MSRSNWVRHTVQVQLRLADLAAVVRDAESGQRGYLATGAEAYLRPWRRAIGAIGPTSDAVADMVKDNPTQQWALAELRPSLDAKFVEIAEMVRLQQSGDVAGAHALLATGRGLSMMAEIRTRLLAMRAEEERLLIERTHDVAWTRGMLPANVGLAGLCALACIGLWIRRVRSAARALEASNREVLEVNLVLDSGNQRLSAEMQRRKTVEGHLHQSQKMEVVGQLTGGIAHDFKNRLLGVSGCLELLLHRSAKNAPDRDGCGAAEIERYAGQALKEAKRAMELTQHLLAFSRQQTLAPETVAPNRMISHMSGLLERTLGAQVIVEATLRSGLWNVRIDPNQLENAVLNLAINARDAMGAGGGRLSLATANVDVGLDHAETDPGVPDGQYVLITVSDTGAGMDAETARRAVEPFFTTKGVGQGTGLGLSQVYGFIAQSGGHLAIDSELGRGTAIKLYLPRYLGEAERPLAIAAREALPDVVNGRPTVLVVDDEAAVREFSVEALAELGYGVLAADSAAAGLDLLDEHPEIALLFTDVVMPGMDGGKLAKEAVRRRPGLPVLFTTGNTRGAMLRNGLLEPGMELLNKPFSMAELGRKVRHVLDEAYAPAA